MRLWPLLAMFGCGDETKPGHPDSGDMASEQDCPVTLVHSTNGAPDSVEVAGTFNDWTPSKTPLEEALPGMWTTTLQLPPGQYPYKFVEKTQWSHGAAELWACDPQQPLIHCEEGTAANLSWAQDCTPGEESCNSLLQVACDQPNVGPITVDGQHSSDGVSLGFSALPTHGAQIVSAEVTAGNQTYPAELDPKTHLFHVEHVDLTAKQHRIEIQVVDTEGGQSTSVVPVNLDDWSWSQAIIYHAMIDRLANGDTSNDRPEGASHEIGDYMGGDLVGLKKALPYLEDLGVNTLWLSNPQAGPEGAWAGQCGATYTGYHGFWPTDWDRIDPHLGTESDLKSVISDAHGRGMRVIIDWVGNHVHQDHPILQTWPESATHAQAICEDSGPDGQLNWDRIPESCWFAPYLPDLDQSDPAVLTASIESAVSWAEKYKLDGLRVDAAKHMPHSVSWNLQSRIAQRLEHTGTGFDFTLLGETFDGADAINAFIDEDQLDGQFDFPLYWQLRDAFIYEGASLRDVVQSASNLESRYPGGTMSTFLGNLDVGRFITTAAEGTTDVCPDGELREAGSPDASDPYDRLLMAWTFLLSQPGMPLIYYGDEMGLPGYGDPDNRQPLWWMADVTDGDVDAVADQLDTHPARVLQGVKALTAARRAQPALATGQTIEWWAAPEDHPTLYAYSRTDGEQGALVVLSRWTEWTTITNNLDFAGLPSGVTYTDVLTGESFESDGDNLSVTVAPMSARLLLPKAN